MQNLLTVLESDVVHDVTQRELVAARLRLLHYLVILARWTLIRLVVFDLLFVVLVVLVVCLVLGSGFGRLGLGSSLGLTRRCSTR